MKNLVKNLKKSIPDADERVLRAIENKDQFHLWFDTTRPGPEKERKTETDE